jgi:hypothetical protein
MEFSPSRPSPTVARLARFLVEDGDSSLSGELTRWLSTSARFRTFADANGAKIRKKLRGATDAESRRDVRAELAVARLLLADRRVELTFEAYGSDRRGPDFTVTLGSQRFNLEVTRLRGNPAGSGFGPLLGKLRQLPPSQPNGVILAIEGDNAREYDVTAAVRTLRTRADSKDEALFSARGFSGTRGFYDRFLRLSSVIVWAEGAAGDSRVSAWTNPSARTPLSPRALRAVVHALNSSI